MLACKETSIAALKFYGFCSPVHGPLSTRSGIAPLFKGKKSPLLPSKVPFPSWGKNFFQKAHFRTPCPSRTIDSLVLKVSVSRLSGVWSGQKVSVQRWSADSEGFLRISFDKKRPVSCETVKQDEYNER